MNLPGPKSMNRRKRNEIFCCKRKINHEKSRCNSKKPSEGETRKYFDPFKNWSPLGSRGKVITLWIYCSTFLTISQSLFIVFSENETRICSFVHIIGKQRVGFVQQKRRKDSENGKHESDSYLSLVRERSQLKLFQDVEKRTAIRTVVLQIVPSSLTIFLLEKEEWKLSDFSKRKFNFQAKKKTTTNLKKWTKAVWARTADKPEKNWENFVIKKGQKLKEKKSRT